MSNTKLNCCKCGKEFELTERIYASGDLWQCEDCAIKQMQENDDKDKTIADLEAKLAESNESHHKNIVELTKMATEKDRKIEELKGERLKFYTDDVRRTQVINGVHFDIEQLLVFSEYVEHEKWIISNRDKEINQLKQQLAEKETRIAELEDKDWYEATIKQLEEQNERIIKERDNANKQNKRVLDKLDIIVRSNQELEKENMELASKIDLLESEKENLFRTLEETGEELAEKDKEIENLNNRILISQLQAPKEQILNILGSQCIQYNPDQDKISFALERLEKVKEEMDLRPRGVSKGWENKEYYTLVEEDVYEVVDNQIKAIKGEK